ncbi:hypothetical protein D3C78_1020150 [compost metagenome]
MKFTPSLLSCHWKLKLLKMKSASSISPVSAVSTWPCTARPSMTGAPVGSASTCWVGSEATLSGVPKLSTKLATTWICRPTCAWVTVNCAPVAPGMSTNSRSSFSICHCSVTLARLTPSGSLTPAIEAVSSCPTTGTPSPMSIVGWPLGSWLPTEWRNSSVPLASLYTARTRMFSPATSSVTRKVSPSAQDASPASTMVMSS